MTKHLQTLDVVISRIIASKRHESRRRCQHVIKHVKECSHKIDQSLVSIPKVLVHSQFYHVISHDLAYVRRGHTGQVVRNKEQHRTTLIIYLSGVGMYIDLARGNFPPSLESSQSVGVPGLFCLPVLLTTLREATLVLQ